MSVRCFLFLLMPLLFVWYFLLLLRFLLFPQSEDLIEEGIELACAIVQRQRRRRTIETNGISLRVSCMSCMSCISYYSSISSGSRISH